MMWIPTDKKWLKKIVMMAAHNGAGEHRGWTTKLKMVSAKFVWKGLEDYFKTFVEFCFHCAATESSSTIPRPLGNSLNASETNEILQLDFCYMGRGENGLIYDMILKEDLSRYVWLLPYQNPDTISTSDALEYFCSAFWVVKKWV